MIGFRFSCPKKIHSRLCGYTPTFPRSLRVGHGASETRESVPRVHSRSSLTTCCGRCPQKRCPKSYPFRQEIRAPPVPRSHQRCSLLSRYSYRRCYSQSRGSRSSESNSWRPLAATASLFLLNCRRGTSLPCGLFKPAFRASLAKFLCCCLADFALR